MRAALRTTAVVFAEAVAHHDAGRIAEAEALYREVLALDAGHVDSLHRLGVIAHQRGAHVVAVRYLVQAINLRPGDPFLHNNMGEAYRARGQFSEAIGHYHRAVTLLPSFAGAYNNLGRALQALGRFEEAAASHRAALGLDPAFADASMNLAAALVSLSRLEEAAACYRSVLAQHPGVAAAHNHLGAVLQSLGRLDEAAESHLAAIAIDPSNADAHLRRGAALQGLWRLGEAEACYRSALALKPDDLISSVNLGVTLRCLGRLDEAVAHHEAALALHPDSVVLLANLGFTLMDQRRTDAAVAAFERMIRLAPDSVEAHTGLGMVRLRAGDFAAGWREYEWRHGGAAGAQPAVAAARWDGGDLDGRAILLKDELGLGDAIQFIRYAPKVAARCGRVVVSCRAPLKRLFEAVDGIDEVIGYSSPPPPDIACWSPLLSLPSLFATTVETIPAAPYLHADPVTVEAWRGRLADRRGLKIGVAWRGNPANSRDRFRSTSPATFARFLGGAGIEVVSLQKDATPEEIAALGAPVFDAGPDLADFAETAAVIANLDLVISVDTSIAHLAGGLGAPVWTLLDFCPEWRWLIDRDDSPWYPSMRLFRQPSFGDWDGLAQRVRAELESGAIRPAV